MATLSKTLIEGIAQKLTEKSKKHSEGLLKEYKEAVTIAFEAQVPDEVKKCFRHHSEYVETTNSAYLDGHGFNRESITLTRQVPATTSFSAHLELTATIADKLLKVKRKWEKARDEYKELYRETESALLALKTHKNIQENLPEAAPYLPPPMSNSLVVNFTSLKKKLHKQPEVKSVVS